MPSIIDLTGQRFGKLVVIELADIKIRNRPAWSCLCDCGNYTIVVGDSLRYGDTKSCGCYKWDVNGVNLEGQVFGRLKVLRRSENIGTCTTWLCACTCGNECIVKTQLLRKGQTKSCGCLHNEFIQGRRVEFPAAKNKYSHYMSSAKNRGYIFNITFDDFLLLTQQNCFYCGCAPYTVFNCNGKTKDFVYNGIDRFYNSVGYEIYNCVPCCHRCNTAKSTMDGPEYLEHCRGVVSYWSDKEMEARYR